MQNFSGKYDLTQGVVWKVMLQFAFPIFLGTLFQSFYTTADAIIIGRFAGKDALAAIESVYTLTKLPVNFFTGLASGATIIISQYYGAKRMDRVSNASHTAILFAFVGGGILSVACFLCSPFFIKLIRVPDEIVHDAQRYVIIYFSALAASMLYNVGAGILRAIGNSKTPFYFLVFANAVNISLDLFFIGVLHAGVAGAAAATFISQVISAILIFVVLLRTDLPCKIYLKKIRFDKIHLTEIFKLGLPIGIQSALYPVSNMIIQANINTFGVNSIAAWAICGKLDFLVWSISDSFGACVSTFVAQNYGAGQYSRVKKGVQSGLCMTSVLILFVSAILYFGSVSLARLLVQDTEVILITSQILHFLAPLYVIYVFCEILPAAIRGTGDTFRPMMITLTGTCVVRVLWVWLIFPMNPTFIMVLSSYPFSWGVTAVMFTVLYISTFKKSVQGII